MSKFWNYLLTRNFADSRLIQVAVEAEKNAIPELQAATEVARINQIRVLEAFRKAGISELHLKDGTGYGYGDLGRQGLEEVYALTFGAEAALVRAQIISGTHAITLALSSLLQPGDELLSVTGTPYDSLATVIGVSGDVRGSFKEQGITYREVSLDREGKPDYQKIAEVLTPKTKVVMIQRSRGYSWRRSLSIKEIEELIKFVKSIFPRVICFVDNCYGEFVEEKEPTHVGADLAAGSLIKNPGGGIAPTGGYLVGKTELITTAADRLFAPGLGNKLGTNLGLGRLFYQGLFLAPQIVGEALKGIIFAAHFFKLLELETSPPPGSPRSDLVQAVKLHTPEAVKAFCRGIQNASPVDSFVVPEPGYFPGYADEIIMAAGTFIEGASLELTADGPLRPPYIVYLQGGLSYAHTVYAVVNAVQELVHAGFIKL
ncbi:MAG: Uncharacterized protein XD63_0931 [Thermoanaerobacterales bacterium 50_218]|nr:MAG: Uncharacterized protein XD63_0931 [Thermoanaerobacterales bacterium 50_218]HAA89924.1 hypothetical protein [Peptococcaceae bacterium]